MNCELLVQLYILWALSRQHWLSNKKDIKEKIPQSRAKVVCSVPKKSRGMATLKHMNKSSSNQNKNNIRQRSGHLRRVCIHEPKIRMWFIYCISKTCSFKAHVRLARNVKALCAVNRIYTYFAFSEKLNWYNNSEKSLRSWATIFVTFRF